MLCEHESAPEDRKQNKSKRIVDSGDEEAQGKKRLHAVVFSLYFIFREISFFFFFISQKNKI